MASQHNEWLTQANVLRALADGYTQTQIAEMYGLDQAHVSRIKNGKAKARIVRKRHPQSALLARLSIRED